MPKGIIYILTNEAMPGLCKIGRTTRSDLTARMNELYTTGVPFQFECVYACEFEDCKKAEDALHAAFGPERVNSKREFFKMDPNRAVVLLKAFGGNEVSAVVKKNLENGTSEEDRRASEVFRARRPNMNFEEMGIPVGGILMFGIQGTQSATVIDSKRVMFADKSWSLTGLTRELLELDYNVQPCGYWYYEGRCLSEIYEETYPREG